MVEVKTKPVEEQASKQVWVTKLNVSYSMGGSLLEGKSGNPDTREYFEVDSNKKIFSSTTNSVLNKNVNAANLDPGHYQYLAGTEEQISIKPTQSMSLTFVKGKQESGSLDYIAGIKVTEGEMTLKNVQYKRVLNLDGDAQQIDVLKGNAEEVLSEKKEKITLPGIFVGLSYNQPLTKKGMDLTISTLAALNMVDKKAIPEYRLGGAVTIPLTEKLKISPALSLGIGGVVEGDLKLNYKPTGGLGISVSYRVIGDKTLSSSISFGF